MGRPRFVINEAAAVAEFKRIDKHMHRRWGYYGVPVSLAEVARNLAVPVRTFQRWADRTGFVARVRGVATKRQSRKVSQ